MIDARTRRLALPAFVVVALVPWIVYCARSYPEHALYFDHAMYQYTAWCIRHGESLYETVAVPDGPLITWLHALVQLVAGESDRAFRWADLVMHVAGASAIGWAIAPRRTRWLGAGAIATLWLAQYFRYDWHWTAQREAYYALLGFLGMALLHLATRRRGRVMVALSLAGGVLVGITMFGKHIGVVFVALGLAPAVLGPRSDRRRRILLALAGVAAATGLGLGLLAITGSVSGFAFWYFEVPIPYRHIMGSADAWPLLLAIDRHTTLLAGVVLVGGVIGVAIRALPRHLLGFVVAPALFLIAMVLQRKGHVYQAHPVTAGAYLFVGIALLQLARRAGRQRIAAAVIAIAVVVDASRELALSTWIDPAPPSGTSQLGAPHIDHGDLRDAARTLARFTRPEDRVFAYGPAGRLLYEAERRPAVPPFTNFFLNLRRAAVVPLTADQRADLERIQREIARRSCPYLREPPAAVVVCDRADWSGGPGLADATEICPELAYVAAPKFVEVGRHGCWRIHVRADRLVTP